MRLSVFLLTILLMTTFWSCRENNPFNNTPNYLALSAFSETNQVQMVVEIPAGTNHKIEFNKTTQQFENDVENGKTRIINFLPYPGNYGFIPGTHMDPARGGDGDALDIILISESLETGTVIEVRPIAAMLLIDNGELDTKLVAVPIDSAQQVFQVADYQSFMINNDPARRILEDWFLNYKGFGEMQLAGWRDEHYAMGEIRKWLKK